MSSPLGPNLQLCTPEMTGDMREHNIRVPASTGLFRATSQLPDVIRQAEARIDGEEINFASVPCSLGAEADSMLSLFRDTRFTRIGVQGVDINPRLIELAKAGNYQTKWTVLEPEEMEQTIGALEDRGFGITDLETRPMMVKPSKYEMPEPTTLVKISIDAKPVRAGQTVDFREGDIEYGVIEPQSQDIVLANNLIYHLPAPRAAPVLWSVARMVKEGGILSLNDEPSTADNETYPMRLEDDSTILYRDWMRVASELMAEMFDLEPIARDATSERPTMLVRSSDGVPKSSDSERFLKILGSLTV